MKYDSIIFDKTIYDSIFDCTDSIFDEHLKGKIPINADCVIDEEDGWVLNGCECKMIADSLFIEIYILSPLEYYHYLNISVFKNNFTSLSCEHNILSVDNYVAHPLTQKLILQSDIFFPGMFVKGYIEFEGKGKYTKDQIEVINSCNPVKKVSKKEIMEGFSTSIKGYFRCKLK